MAGRNSARNLRKQAAKLVKAGRLPEAAAILAPLCKSLPDDIDSWMKLADIYWRLNDYHSSERCCQHVLGLEPEHTLAMHTLASNKHMTGDVSTAIRLYHKALEAETPLAETCYFLANAYREAGYIDNAQVYYEKLLQLAPDHFEGINNLAALYTHRGIIGKSIELLRKADRIKPDYPFVLNNLAKAYQIAGRQQEAIDTFRKLLAGDQYNLDMVSNYLLSLNYLPSADQATIYLEHARWSDAFGDIGTVKEMTGNSHACGDTSSVIRLGFVSADFKDHPVARFILPFFHNYDRDRFSIHCFSDVVSGDAVTAEMKSLVDGWSDCHAIDRDRMLSIIRGSGIDILIDLSGHTANNRMGVFAKKPANLQCSYIGYPNTTGLKTMDFRIVDAITDPADASDRFHSEELVRLPGCFLSYYPDTQESPESHSETARGIMFGSFNNLAKVTPDVVSAWSEILGDTESSKLTLKSSSSSDAGVQSYFLEQFKDCGIDADRVVFLNSQANKQEHYRCYNTVDIALDTFPYNGTTTTFDALWMGVPVVTLSGHTHAGRVGHSILSSLSLDNLVADDRKQYKDIAVELANNRKHLNELHLSLRELMKHSILLDHRKHTNALESVFMDMYYRFR